jgi:hypothetical protein
MLYFAFSLLITVNWAFPVSAAAGIVIALAAVLAADGVLPIVTLPWPLPPLTAFLLSPSSPRAGS